MYVCMYVYKLNKVGISFLVAFLSAILKMQSLGGYAVDLLPTSRTKFAKRKGLSFLLTF